MGRWPKGIGVHLAGRTARDGSGSRPTDGGCVNGRARATNGSPDARPVNMPPDKGAKAYSPRGRLIIDCFWIYLSRVMMVAWRLDWGVSTLWMR
jgi:hypothetical protein